MTLLLGFSSGLLVGICHFWSLRWLCQRLTSDGAHRWWPLLAMYFLRITLLACAAIIAVGYGATTLIALALGVIVIRSVLISQAKHQSTMERSC